VDDDRIRQIRDEVLAALSAPPGQDRADLEARVAALERAVSALSAPSSASVRAVALTSAALPSHPSLRLLDVSGGSGQCVLEPDRPCVQSGQCRQLGH
jgi:hypothetical protein